MFLVRCFAWVQCFVAESFAFAQDVPISIRKTRVTFTVSLGILFNLELTDVSRRSG